MVRVILIVVSLALIIVGSIVLPMPIPLGAIMIVLGLTLLVSQSKFVADRLRAFRLTHSKTDKVIRKVEDRLPAKLRDILRRTDP